MAMGKDGKAAIKKKTEFLFALDEEMKWKYMSEWIIKIVLFMYDNVIKKRCLNFPNVKDFCEAAATSLREEKVETPTRVFKEF